MPFTPRWFPQIDDATIAMALKAGVLHGYEVLIERTRGYVAQYEDTIYVGVDSVVPLARTLDLL